jgi:hypothetical protein
MAEVGLGTKRTIAKARGDDNDAWVRNVLAKNFSGLLVNGSYEVQVINRE